GIIRRSIRPEVSMRWQPMYGTFEFNEDGTSMTFVGGVSPQLPPSPLVSPSASPSPSPSGDELATLPAVSRPESGLAVCDQSLTQGTISLTVTFMPPTFATNEDYPRDMVQMVIANEAGVGMLLTAGITGQGWSMFDIKQWVPRQDGPENPGAGT